MNPSPRRHGPYGIALAIGAMVVAGTALLATGPALAVNKDPPKTKVGPPRETHGAPPCVPQQDFSGNYVCTDSNGTRWNCTIEGTSGWHCTEAQDPPPRGTRPRR